MSKFRIALVGCGKIAQNHLKALAQLKQTYELVGLSDPNSMALSQFTQEHSVPGYSDLTSLVANTKPALVSLCTPSGLHAKQAIELAKLGCDVITEKPMATKWRDALKMMNVFNETKRQLFVVKQNRFLPTVQLLKQAIQEGRFGRIYMVNVNVFWTRPQAYYDQAKWRGTWDMDGGAFMNQASHYVDLLDWLIGPVQSVYAQMATLGRQVEVEDTGTLNIRWRSGTIGSMNVTMLTFPKNLEASITILGEKGTVKLSGNSINQIDHWEFSEKTAMDNTIHTASEMATASLGSGHIAYYQNVADALNGCATEMVDGCEGLRSMEILTAAYLSAREQKAIALPLEI